MRGMHRVRSLCERPGLRIQRQILIKLNICEKIQGARCELVNAVVYPS